VTVLSAATNAAIFSEREPAYAAWRREKQRAKRENGKVVILQDLLMIVPVS
jgi:hypothetical protein